MLEGVGRALAPAGAPLRGRPLFPRGAMTEAQLVRKIISAVGARYPRAYVRKLADRHSRGIPDLLIVYPRELDCGHHATGVLFVECKSATGRVSRIQQAEHAAIARVGTLHGCSVLVARDVQNVLYTLELWGAVK